MSKSDINLKQDKVVQLIKMLALSYKSIDSIIIFGSRARGDHQPISDYDFAVKWNNDSENSSESWGQFAGAMRERNPTLNTIDLLLIDDVALPLRASIEKEGITIYEKN